MIRCGSRIVLSGAKMRLSILTSGALFVLTAAGMAAPPLVRTVPADATDRTRAHETFAARPITLKGTSSVQGEHIRAT